MSNHSVVLQPLLKKYSPNPKTLFRIKSDIMVHPLLSGVHLPYAS